MAAVRARRVRGSRGGLPAATGRTRLPFGRRGPPPRTRGCPSCPAWWPACSSAPCWRGICPSHPQPALGPGSRGRGRLDARVRPLLGGRRDEIADLAEDFDRMAQQIQTLVGAQRRLLRCFP
ncbi:HAMP domain-containing protein [Zoogloea sp.]|uniref:HAMP domain-containing protein n=1 Tax=Zoogloea sp. TaxID=49181 RepID=UPI00345BFCB6